MSSNGNASQPSNTGLSKYGLSNSDLTEKEWKQIYTRVKNIVPEGFTDDQIATLVVESRGDDFIIEQYINKWIEGNSLGEDEWKSTKKTKDTRKTHNSSYRSNEFNSNKSDERRMNKHNNNSSRSSDETPRSYSKNNNNKSRYPSHNNTSRSRPRPVYEEPVEPIEYVESVESTPVSNSVSVVVNTPPGVYNAWLDDSKLTMAQRIALKNQKKENKPKKAVTVVEPEVIPEPECIATEAETISNTEIQEEVAQQEQIENIIETIESETVPVEETVVIESVPTETTETVVEEQVVEPVEEEQTQEAEPEVVEQIIEEVPVETEQEEETFVPPSFSLGHWSIEEEGSDVEFGEVDYVPEESIPVPEVIAVEETVVETPAPVVEESIRETYVSQEENQVQEQPSVSMTTPVNPVLPETAAASIMAQDSDIIEQQILQETLPASVSTPVKEPETLPVTSPAPASVSNKTVPPVYSNNSSTPMNNGMYTPNMVSNNSANANNTMGNPMFYDTHYQGMMGPYYNYVPMDNNNNNMYMNGMMPPVDTTNTPPPGLNRTSANDTNNTNDINNNMNNPNNVYYNNNMNPPMNIYPGYFPYFYNNTFSRMPNYRNGNNDMNYNDSTYVNHDNTATNTAANTNAHKSYNDNNNNRHNNNNNNNGSQMYPNPYLYQQNYMYPQMSYPQPHY